MFSPVIPQPDPAPPADEYAPSPPMSPPTPTAEALTPAVKPPVPPAIVESPTFRGSFRLIRLAGTDVFVHWSWFVAGYFLIQNRVVPYSSVVWDAAAYVALFVLVLLHEFGHVVGCRLVGGTADRVVLWPLGGLAFVAPPPRPGATLWTIASGPLVNVALAPVLIVLAVQTAPAAESDASTNLPQLFEELAWLNAVMLVFNLLPVFPLDGGRILQAVLWRLFGRSTGLAVAAGVGLFCGTGLGVLALAFSEWWLAATAGFLVLGAFGGLSHSRLIARMGQAERRVGLACPNCGLAPPLGDFWCCTRCLAWLDLFAPSTGCPRGGGHITNGACPECGLQPGLSDWSSLGTTEPGEQMHAEIKSYT